MQIVTQRAREGRPLSVGTRARNAMAQAIAWGASLVVLAVLTGAARRSHPSGRPWSWPLAAATVLSVLLAVSSYGALCGWMERVRDVRRERHLGGPPTWRIWFSWFVPLYGLVVPFLVMRDLGKGLERAPSDALLTAWWLPSLLAVLAWPSLDADMATHAGRTVNVVVVAALLCTSTVSLVQVVRRTTSALDKPDSA